MKNKKQMRVFSLLMGVALLAGCNGAGKKRRMVWLTIRW